MRGFLYFLCFLLTLPVLGVLGHDIWHAMNDKNGLDLTKPFPFSDAGWLWTTYAPDTYEWTHANIDKPAWMAYIDPVLKQKAVIVTLVPALCMYALLLLLKLLGLPPFQGSGWLLFRQPSVLKKGKDFAFKDENDKKNKKVKYKRK